MAAIKPIRTEADYEAALARAGTLMDAESGPPEGEELAVLVDLIVHYEAKHVPTGYPSPPAAIEFRLEQGGPPQRAIVPLTVSRAKGSAVRSGNQQALLTIARAPH